MKNILIAFICLFVVGGAVYYFISKDQTDVNYEKPELTPTQTENNIPEVETPVTENEVATPTVVRGEMEVIGQSVGGEDIVAYHFGTGDKEALFIGGIHGGYSWNTALLAYELIDWLKKTPTAIPDDVSVTIIPTLNPDGLKKIAGTSGSFTAASITGTEADKAKARFNNNNVDLNRNFSCEWKAVGTWQNQSVSGGSEPFSEPETKAIRAYVAKYEPSAVVTWYSAAGGVYASNCKQGILPETKALTELFAKASGYSAHEEFNYYEITGDMVNWFASENIPAISVLLTDHKNSELNKNKAGVEAVLNYLAE
ncbi:MAG: M14 family zinc carboxypeptidase [Candidatus Paceibacterota bacterium]